MKNGKWVIISLVIVIVIGVLYYYSSPDVPTLTIQVNKDIKKTIEIEQGSYTWVERLGPFYRGKEVITEHPMMIANHMNGNFVRIGDELTFHFSKEPDRIELRRVKANKGIDDSYYFEIDNLYDHSFKVWSTDSIQVYEVVATYKESVVSYVFRLKILS